MLSRTASSLYWLGRYFERADFIARLVEATVRLDVLSSQPAGEAAWASALAVTETDTAFEETGDALDQAEVVRFLTLDAGHPGSIVRCLDMARNNAKAVRTALTREAWTTINRAWLLFENRASPRGATETLNLVNGIVILGGNELFARNFCNSELNIAVSKRPDLVAKVNNRYVVGEAKFLSSTGGNQGTGFEDGIKLATNSNGIAYKIFVLDGIHWIEKGSAQHKRIESTQATILSALLLENFLSSLL